MFYFKDVFNMLGIVQDVLNRCDLLVIFVILDFELIVYYKIFDLKRPIESRYGVFIMCQNENDEKKLRLLVRFII